MTSTRVFAAMMLFLPLLGSCGENMSGVSALRLEIRDGTTSQPAASQATVIVRDGSYADTVRGAAIWAGAPDSEALFLSAADDRPGTYEVTVTHPRFQVWRQENVRARPSGGISPFDGSPEPEQIHLVVLLQPLD